MKQYDLDHDEDESKSLLGKTSEGVCVCVSVMTFKNVLLRQEWISSTDALVLLCVSGCEREEDDCVFERETER